MSEQTKTPWRKNLDPRYISGEDLLLGMKGLRPTMVVCIEKQADAPAFDQKEQKEVSKTALSLFDLETKQKVYKPVLLNVTRAEFLTKETGSIYIEDWYGVPFVMWSKPDKRHGHVVAFKKYYPPATVTDTNALAKLNASATLGQLGEAWTALTAEEKKLPTVLAKKEELKTKLP